MRTTPLMLAVAMALGLPAVTSQAAPVARPADAKAERLQVYIVGFEEPAAARFRGFDPGDTRRPKLSPTSARVTGAAKYNPDSVEARAYVDYLDDLRAVRLGEASRRVGRGLEPIHTYSHALNGVALRLTATEAEVLRSVPGVSGVRPDFVRYLQTDTGPTWIGANLIWNGTATGTQRRGEGVVVGVIDSGLNRNHVAFSGTGYTNPRPQLYGYCALPASASACNGKVIGLWNFTVGGSGQSDPTDSDGHGTHVASTAAGNPFTVSGLTFSGVAPRAHLIAYKACPDDSCLGSALLASIDRATQDAVDVINYSIGGGATDPWATVTSAGLDDEEAFLGAREAGIFIAVSAGNEGPNPGTVGGPSNSPWVMSVAAATHNRNGLAAADVLASFSSRGPVVPFNVLKPDVTAPGVAIVAATHTNTTGTANLSGTSMAAPHVAGAAALIKSTRPAFTADQLVSALSLTARPVVRLTAGGTLAHSHEQGAGRIDASLAVNAAAYLEVPANAFRNARANIYTGGADALNTPTLTHAGCFRTCSFTRSIKLMPGAPSTTYSVQVNLPAGASMTPSAASITPDADGETLVFNLDVDNPALVGQWLRGDVTLVNTSGNGRPNLRLPVTVYVNPFANEASVPATQAISAATERGFVDINLGGMVPLNEARFVATNLVAPTVSTVNITVDPTPNEAYDNVSSNNISLVTIPASASPVRYRLRASTTAASPDIDLFVGRDANSNNLPSQSEELCYSASAGSNEVCDIIVTSEAVARNYWVMVQNYSGPGTNVRIERVAIPLTAGTDGRLVASGPGRVPATTPYRVRLGYDDASAVQGDVRYGALLIQGTPGNTVYELPVSFSRTSSNLAPFALAPGVPRSYTLAAGVAHETLVFDVPANATSVTFSTQGTGSVSLYAARVGSPTSPVVALAPARNAPGVIAATAAGANQSITATVAAGTLQPGRWYVTPVNTGGTAATVNVQATINSVGSALPLTPGSYYNASRGGHGVFIYPSASELVMLWYTYLQDGTPTWYYAQGPIPTAHGVWNGTLYRSAWDGDSNVLVQVGNAVLAPQTADTFSLSYNLDGFTGVEPMTFFLKGCPSVSGTPLNVSAHWFAPAKPGYGYSVQVNPNYEFLATFVYDGLGFPRFLTAERGGAFQAGTNPVDISQLQGFAPLGAYVAPTRSTVGTLTRSYGVSTINTISANATFTNGVPGSWSENASVSALGSTQGCTP